MCLIIITITVVVAISVPPPVKFEAAVSNLRLGCLENLFEVA